VFIFLFMLSVIFSFILLDVLMGVIVWSAFMFTSCCVVIVLLFSVLSLFVLVVSVVVFLAPVNAPLWPVTTSSWYVSCLYVISGSVMFICPSFMV